MRIQWAVAVALGLCITQVSAQVAPRWYDLYRAADFETLFSGLQRDATGDLYVLLSLCRTEDDDGLALVRYNARGTRLSVEPFGLNNGRQERGIALFLRPEGGLYIVAETHQPPHRPTTPPADDTETLVYAYPGTGTPVFLRAGTPTNALLLSNTLYWAANPPEVVRFSPSQSASRTLQNVDYLLGLTANLRNGLLSTYGWIGTSQGRRGAFLVSAAPNLPTSPQTVGGSFGYVAEVFPIAPNNLLILRGAADETQARMYHDPSGLEADRIQLRVSYGDTLYLYLLATEPEGGATLVRLDPTTQTRLWTVNLPSARIGPWTVDAEHRVHLLDAGTEFPYYPRFEWTLWVVEPNGTVRRFAFRNPLLRQFWFFSGIELLPVGRFQWLVGASAYRDDNDNDIFEPLHSFVGFFALEGDANGDGCVNNDDLLAVLLSFGSSDPDADVNGDGVVNNDDLLLVLFNFGIGC